MARARCPAGEDEWKIEVSPTLLFRFSALTYNAHRIHYDRDYARDVEGYPGLLTHGPLQALAMAEAARAAMAAGPWRRVLRVPLALPLFHAVADRDAELLQQATADRPLAAERLGHPGQLRPPQVEQGRATSSVTRPPGRFRPHRDPPTTSAGSTL